ncbi:MAG: secretin N-terminal domain-containing protein [Planctomycetota bacterium]
MKTTGAWKATVRYGALFVLIAASWTTAAEEAVKPELLSPVQQRMQQEISLDFKDTLIDDVLMIMAKQADVDIIKSPKVEGTVTATLTDVPLAEALTSILEAHGYAYVTTDNIIRVVPKNEIFEVREKLVSRVFRITYADVKDVEKALKQFISDQGAISANPGTSNIIVTDTESKVKAINSFIEEIDRVTPQILVSAQIYDVTSQDSLDLGVKWQAGTATDFGQPTTDQTYGNNFDTIGNIVGGITDTAIGSTFNSGINQADTSGLLRIGVLNDSIQVDAAIFAAQDDVRAKLLANPRVLVLDNEEAEIKIVEEIPYQQLTHSTEGGQGVGTTEFRDVGVELRVIPHLTRDGLIHLQLNPKFSTITGSVNIVSGSDTIPQPVVATRETTTTALIKDRQTVVIGGLKKQDKIQETSKIPLLGDLPLLGAAFRFEGESTVNSELVVFITPQVIVKPALTSEEERYLADSVYVSPSLPETKLGNGEE